MRPADAPTAHRRLPRADLLMAVAMLAWLGLSMWRAQLVDAALAGYLDCTGCMRAPVLYQDLWLMLVLPAALLLARWSGTRWIALPLAAGVAVLAIAFAADVFVQRLLSRRLLLPDIGRYGGEFDANWSVLQPLLATPEGLAMLAGSLVLLVAASTAVIAAPSSPRRHGMRAWLGLLAVLALLAWWRGPTWYLNRGAYENVVAINLGDGMAREYGGATLARLQATPPPAPVCAAGLGRRTNVLVLVVESWSLRHSALFSGLDDLTPRMDALARRGSWYPDFRSNGFSTEGALAALLTGHAPLSGIRYGTIMLFTEVSGDLHRRLQADGTDLRFFTSGDLDYTGRRRWLDRIGIAQAEGTEHPAYEGRTRGAFKAASDAALLQRVLQWYDGERGEGRFVATVLTVGMHPPFVALDGAAPGEGGAVAATDAAVGDFVDALEARGFFDDGLLFVVGDHRVMAPIQGDELRRFGDDALVRVPAFVLGASGTPPGAVAGDFQQVDLLPSLQRQLMDGEACRSVLQGDLFGPRPQPAAVQLYADPMRYDQIRARVGGRNHVFVLDGDDSRWQGAAPEAGFDLGLEIARLRVARDRPPAE